MNAQWEYKTVMIKATGWFSGGKVDVNELDERLNALGQDGWELASGFDTNKLYGETRDVVLIFKRPA
ncbi:MAG: DUF4177 domain-containing protein [Phycisphaerae bacterium]|nr:DUF4177 domain-containing protein [Phycisphaerae bacterium]